MEQSLNNHYHILTLNFNFAFAPVRKFNSSTPSVNVHGETKESCWKKQNLCETRSWMKTKKTKALASSSSIYRSYPPIVYFYDCTSYIFSRPITSVRGRMGSRTTNPN